jgi:hypothetical protein
MCLPCPARVPNIAIHLSRLHMSPVCPNVTLRPGDGERWAMSLLILAMAFCPYN